MHFSDQKLKIKLLVGIMSVFFFLLVAFFYVLYQEEKSLFLQSVQEKRELVSTTMQQVSSDLNKEMLIIIENIVHNDSIVEAFKNKDRKKLFEYTFGIYQLIRNENPYYSIMHFHLKDGTSFLRLHNLEKFGDNLTNIRPMIDFVHKNHVRVVGFEMGKYDSGLLTYRVAVPIFDKQHHYLGTLELGINSQVFMQRMTNLMAGNRVEGAFFIKKEAIAHLKSINQEELTSEYIKANATSKFIAQDIYKDMNFDAINFELHNQSYLIELHSDAILNYQLKPLGSSVIQFNITQSENRFHHFLRTMLILLILLFIIIFTQVYYGFNRFIDYIHQERHNVSLEREKLKQEQNKVQAILNAQANIIILSDGDRLKIVNQGFLDFFCMSHLDDFIQVHNCVCDLFVPHKDFFSLEDISEEKNWIIYLKNQPIEKRRITLVDANFEPRAFELHIQQYELEHQLYVIEFHDITQMMVQQKKLYHEANTDKLTALFNRNYFLSKLDELSLQTKEKGLKLSLIMFDIDHFKMVNDTYGHDIGDEVLKVLASDISAQLRHEDIFARWGGEEFLILLPDVSLQSAARIAEKLRETLDNIDEKGIPHFTSSFGVVEFKLSETVAHFLKRVDDNLYEAKDKGRNRVIY